jgi:hypothetical protein
VKALLEYCYVEPMVVEQSAVLAWQFTWHITHIATIVVDCRSETSLFEFVNRQQMTFWACACEPRNIETRRNSTGRIH